MFTTTKMVRFRVPVLLQGWRFYSFPGRVEKGGIMDFHIGDPVMHWTFGLGQVVGLQEQVVSGQKTIYYEVKVRDLTVWVPADGNLESRLRSPTPAAAFKQLFAILAGARERLPDNRQERKNRLMEQLSDGRAESLCRVVRDLTAYRLGKPFCESDQYLLKRVQNVLLGEWGFSLSISVFQAESDLSRLLKSGYAA
jgi:RNA polymerase-interacting CarD/CdnL/TRCF family regulator